MDMTCECERAPETMLIGTIVRRAHGRQVTIGKLDPHGRPDGFYRAPGLLMVAFNVSIQIDDPP